MRPLKPSVTSLPMTAYRSNGGVLVPVTSVRLSQPILYFEEDKLVRLVNLMKKGCELPPIQVQEQDCGFYQVFDGHHRLAASHRCAFTEIPAEIVRV